MPRMPENSQMSVDVRTGAFEYHAVDLVIPARGFDLRIERWHSSLRYFSDWYGWRFGWDERLELDEGDGSVRHYGAGDRLSRFVPKGDGTYDPAVGWVRNRFEVLGTDSYAVTWPDGTRSHFGGDGRLRRRVDPFGNTLSFFWKGDTGLLDRIVDSSGRVVTATWEDGDRRLRLADWSGRELVYTFEEPHGFMTSYRDPEGNLTRYERGTTFDGIASITTPGGELWVRNYGFGDVPQRTMVGRQTFANGLARDFVYNLASRTTTLTEAPYQDDGTSVRVGPPERTSTYRWNESGNLVEKADALGNVWTYEYDANNRVTKTTDPRGATVEKTFDARGNMLTRKNEKGHTWTYEYHPTFDRVTRITGPGPFHLVEEFTYDGTTGALLSRKDPLLRTTTYEYGPDGLLKKVTPPGSNPNLLEFTYDGLGHLTEVRNGLGQVRTFGYDAVGNQVQATDPLGHRVTREHDRLNRVVRVRSPLGNTTRMAYDGRGNLVTITDPLNRGTRFEYSGMNELMRVVDPAGGSVAYSYDLHHNLVEQVDPNGHAYRFEYDALDRQTRVVDPMGQVTETEHSPFCGTTTITDAEGAATTLYRDVTCLATERVFADGSAFRFSYDEEQRRTRMTAPQPLKFGQFTYGTEKYGHDPADDTTFSWDGNHRLTQVTWPGSRTLGIGWDEAGRLSSLTDLHGTTLTYGYDAGNRLIAVTRAGKTTTYQYDEAGRLITLAYPNGVTCGFTYDSDSRVTRMLWEKNAGLLYHLEYRYDRAGNRTRRRVTKAPGAAITEDFNYDALSRLVRVDEDGGLRAQYRYDPAGNRLLKKGPEDRSGGAASEEFSEYDASDELVATNALRFRWDRVGQLVEKDDPAQENPTRYDWNYAHRLRKVTLPDRTSAEYRYDGDELRTWRREPSGAETHYYWVPGGVLGLSQVLNELDGTGAPKASYVLGPNGLIALIDGGGNERYYIFDALGSVLALTDEAGTVTDTYTYDEYGGITSTIGSSVNGPRFGGQTLDYESEFYYFRNRHYAPTTGNFLRRDPIGHFGGANLYSYAEQDPVSLLDPEGLAPLGYWDPERSCCDDFWCCLGTCIEQNDPLNLLEKGLLYGVGGAIPKSVVKALGYRVIILPGSSRFTTIPSFVSMMTRSGARSGLRTLGRTAFPVWLAYGDYMAYTEANCATICAGYFSGRA